jgi:endogenous inhibitor of DNA gyrase (YacG/DUF329 family)
MKHQCPICSKPTDSETIAEFPFCSERCKQIDLGNWAAERYVISEPAFDEDDLEKLMLDEEETDKSANDPSDSDDPAN